MSIPLGVKAPSNEFESHAAKKKMWCAGPIPHRPAIKKRHKLSHLTKAVTLGPRATCCTVAEKTKIESGRKHEIVADATHGRLPQPNIAQQIRVEELNKCGHTGRRVKVSSARLVLHEVRRI